MTDMVMGPATRPAEVTPLPSSVNIDEEISALENHLAQLHAARDARAVEDTEPWVLDYSDDQWDGSPAVGAAAFSRHVQRFRLLTAEDEVMLAHRIEAGVFAQERLDSCVEMLRTQRRGLEHVVREGEEARERMILANVRLVVMIARKHLPRATSSMGFEDLQQAGLIGLMRAVDKFDHSLGHKFSTYATWWITQSMRRSIDDESRTIRLPVHVVDKSRGVDTARRKAGLTWDEAVADPTRLGDDVTAEHVQRTRQLLRPCLSLDDLTAQVDIVDDQDSDLDVVLERTASSQTWKDLSEHLES